MTTPTGRSRTSRSFLLTREHMYEYHRPMSADFLTSAATLAAAEPGACDRAGVAELVSVALQARSWLDAFEAGLARRARELDGSAAELLTGAGKRRSRDAETIAGRAAVLETMPALHDALARGAVSAGHVDAVARAAERLQPAERAELVELAPSLVSAAEAAASVEAFERDTRKLAQMLAADRGVGRHERLRRQRSVRRWVDQQGLHHTHVTLDPESDAKFSAALDAAVAAERTRGEHGGDEERTFEQLKADAFVSLATGARTGERRHGEVLVLIDHDTLTSGPHAQSVCETNDGASLPVETVRRMCCDADIIPVVLGGDGAVLDAGRARRVASASQRRALRAMYRSCGFPGCSVRFGDCEIHHVLEWIEQRGPTDLDNLLPLCSRHHHLVHDGHWHLALHADRTLTVRRPDGTIYRATSTVNVAPQGVRTEDSELQRVLGEAVERAITRTRRRVA
jgi:hypothetical protein